jgi:exopolyphosphatase / guanosine-5'-triphosphate,3'-diphosphate pyrophosphatase
MDRNYSGNMRRIASIDIGTNTALMVIADIDDAGTIHPIRDVQRFPRLGSDVDRQKRISPPSVDRLLIALHEYVVMARDHGVVEILAAGTSALRDAANRDDVVRRIADETGIAVTILSGHAEAEYTFTGALSGLTVPAGTTGVLDIGGGSTELSIGTPDLLQRTFSLNIGSVRLTERYFPSLPPTKAAFEDAAAFIARNVSEGIEIDTLDSLIGVAGTVTTLAAIDLSMEEFDPRILDNHRLGARTVREMLQTYKDYSIEGMRNIPQIPSGREDILLAGILILDTYLEHFNIHEIRTSTRGLRYGHILAHLRKNERHDRGN